VSVCGTVEIRNSYNQNETMFQKNPRAQRQSYSQPLRDILNSERTRENRVWLASWARMSPEPTPLYRMDTLSAAMNVQSVFIKDEAWRAPQLDSFKALGAPIALARLIMRSYPSKGLDAQGLFSGSHASEVHAFTAVSATDGNHGRALAAAAHDIGCRCVIVLHKNVSEEREAAIAAFGAQVIRIDGGYDDSVNYAAALAEQNEWFVVSDTSYEGYVDVPRDVMQGYGLIAAEALDQVDLASREECPFTHVFLQGGVGGLAAGVVSYFWEIYGANRPVFVVVEPDQADCLFQSATVGKPSKASGTVDSIMAGLACGETSPLAWKFLESAVDFFVTITDDAAVSAMRELASGAGTDQSIVSGESGAAGLAGLSYVSEDRRTRELVGLDSNSRILLVNTEGATAPAVYSSLVGKTATEVRTGTAF
jgi:diaminopropionate ammonia-lyase